MDERLSVVENRVTLIEEDLKKLRKTVHDMKDEQQVLVGEFSKFDKKVDKLISFIDGTDKLFGFCRTHWRTLLKFGCGFVTAYGFTNPAVGKTATYISHFFGL